MKAVFSLMLAFGFVANLFAQEEVEPIYTRELGVNFTEFIDATLDFGGGGTGINPYFLTYKRFDETGKGIRMGAGVSLSQQGNKEELGDEPQENVKQSFVSLDYRVGKEWQKLLTKRLSWYYGFDGLFGYSLQRSKSVDTDGPDVTIKSVSNRGMLGCGPVVGFQLMFNDKIGIFTEGSFYLNGSYRVRKITFDGTNEEDQKFTNSLISLSTSLPTNIYLFVRF